MSLVHTTLLVKFILFFCLISSSLNARESFEFNLGQRINILSDKAFRKTKENEFEAIGNVVITHLKNSIYGERAKINFNSGVTYVEGNVRYISPETTLYGTKLEYNFINRKIELENARIVADSFSVVGKKIIQNSSTDIEAFDAEYTTCKDCPESWSVFGSKIKITVGKYVRIKNAYIKVNGIITMYIPYIVFPIKQDRETGLLFPGINFKSDEGLKYQQPFFWAINDQSDMTISPAVYGKRGHGGEFQYRHYFYEKTWFEANFLGVKDQIYSPYKINKEKTGKKENRTFSEFEFHTLYKTNVNGHIYYNTSSDLDTKRDFSSFINNRFTGLEYGGGGFLEYRQPFFNINVESYFNENMLVYDPHKFDDEYVQLLPKITLSSIPYNLIHTDTMFFRNFSLGFQSDYSIFKQNKFVNNSYIRNAHRLNLAPYIDWQLGRVGPIFLSNTVKYDYQRYYLPRQRDTSFLKRGFIYETEAKFELERIFGIARVEKNEVAEIDGENNSSSNLVGSLPTVKLKKDDNIVVNKINSYRHTQEFKLKHYYLGDQSIKGNQIFYSQIQNDKGQFDYLDAIRAKEHSVTSVAVSDSLPLSNTLELQWNNSLIRKSSKDFDPYQDGVYLKDNFSYKNISYFDMSQGLDLNVISDRFTDKLTRLYLKTGINFDQMSTSIEEFYFHRTGEHKLSSSLDYTYNQFTIGGSFTYNSFNSETIAVTKLIAGNIGFNVTDMFRIKTSIDYNLESKKVNKNTYSLMYVPVNNCWKTEVSYFKDQIEKRIGFIFYLNYSENNFASINLQ